MCRIIFVLFLLQVNDSLHIMTSVQNLIYQSIEENNLFSFPAHFLNHCPCHEQGLLPTSSGAHRVLPCYLSLPYPRCWDIFQIQPIASLCYLCLRQRSSSKIPKDSHRKRYHPRHHCGDPVIRKPDKLSSTSSLSGRRGRDR